MKSLNSKLVSFWTPTCANYWIRRWRFCVYCNTAERPQLWLLDANKQCQYDRLAFAVICSSIRFVGAFYSICEVFHFRHKKHEFPHHGVRFPDVSERTFRIIYWHCFRKMAWRCLLASAICGTHSGIEGSPPFTFSGTSWFRFGSFFILLNFYSKNKTAPLQGTEHDLCSGASTLDAGWGGHANERCIEGQRHPATANGCSSSSPKFVHMHVNASIDFQWIWYHSRIFVPPLLSVWCRLGNERMTQFWLYSGMWWFVRFQHLQVSIAMTNCFLPDMVAALSRYFPCIHFQTKKGYPQFLQYSSWTMLKLNVDFAFRISDCDFKLFSCLLYCSPLNSVIWQLAHELCAKWCKLDRCRDPVFRCDSDEGCCTLCYCPCWCIGSTFLGCCDQEVRRLDGEVSQGRVAALSSTSWAWKVIYLRHLFLHRFVAAYFHVASCELARKRHPAWSRKHSYDILLPKAQFLWKAR